MEHSIKLTDRNAAAIALVNLAKANPREPHQAEGSRVQVTFQDELDLYFVKWDTDAQSVSWSDYWDAVGHVENSLATEVPQGSIHRGIYVLGSNDTGVHFSSQNGSEVWTRDQAEQLVKDLIECLPPVQREDLVTRLWEGWD